MNQAIFVTIGLPFYNTSLFLESAIKSILAQTYTDFELILTDDGSTDNSLQIAKSFNDPRIIILSDKKNKGISYRLNEQISIARGKYFVRMDADDLMFPSRLEKQIAYLESNPDIDVIGSQAIVIDDDNRIIGLRDSILPATINDALQKSIFIHPTVAGKTEWFRKFGYSDELKGVEDFDLWIRSFNQSKFYILDEPLLFYRDPLKIKLKTYRFRQQQLRKCIWSNRNLIKTKSLILSTIKSYLKDILFRTASSLQFDQMIVSRRNKPIKDILFNSNQLNKLTF